MRENRLSGSEGGGTEANQSFLPLSDLATSTLEAMRSQAGQLSTSHLNRLCYTPPALG